MFTGGSFAQPVVADARIIKLWTTVALSIEIIRWRCDFMPLAALREHNNVRMERRVNFLHKGYVIVHIFRFSLNLILRFMKLSRNKIHVTLVRHSKRYRFFV